MGFGEYAAVGMLADLDRDDVEQIAKRLHDRLTPECVHDDDWDCLDYADIVIHSYHAWLAANGYVILPVRSDGERPSMLPRTLAMLAKAGFKNEVLEEIEDVVDFLVGLGWDGRSSAVEAIKTYCVEEVKK